MSICFYTIQPPSGGCVLKQQQIKAVQNQLNQPPSGGCVLKQKLCQILFVNKVPAAFRRLCVETLGFGYCAFDYAPAAFRRLCVETPTTPNDSNSQNPAAFRRLCVETGVYGALSAVSGLQPPSGGCVLKPLIGFRKSPHAKPAAFRRLCVETVITRSNANRRYPAAFRRLCVETLRTSRPI